RSSGDGSDHDRSSLITRATLRGRATGRQSSGASKGVFLRASWHRLGARGCVLGVETGNSLTTEFPFRTNPQRRYGRIGRQRSQSTTDRARTDIQHRPNAFVSIGLSVLSSRTFYPFFLCVRFFAGNFLKVEIEATRRT